ncbi:hypothetical protein B0H16DRAFT_1745517 [Mycena metata]|uniref:RING-type domain-containing protein n=1 Tax=Mycena metata TaxID=1033252 RepID=A0AAD7H3L1_9AGAR|nr:hypothetical protein B0H16DRAFT_1745517 [Mycena metata]
MMRLPNAGRAPARPPPKKKKKNTFSSSATNPLLVNENGNIVDKLNSSPPRMSPSSPPKAAGSNQQPELRRSPGGGIIYPGIMGGPPSLIKGDTHAAVVSVTRLIAAATRNAASACPYQRACNAVAGGSSPPVASGSRRRYRSPKPIDRTRVFVPSVPLRIRKKPAARFNRNGIRAVCDPPLCDANLYLTDDRPATDVDPKDPTVRPLGHHICPICLGPKSHPVTNPCGHTHCYVCIRKSVEVSWECPPCRRLITTEPVHNFDLECAIANDHPTWVDKSVVSFSWAGLQWPSLDRLPVNSP